MTATHTRPMRDEIRIAWVFWTAVALSGVAAIWAVFGARDLVYDGSYYLLGVAAHGGFQLYEPPRATVHILQQCFAVAGTRLGIQDLWRLGQLFSLGASGWPVFLTGLCWLVLPRDNKSWIAGPLFNLVFAIPATSFIGVGEGIISSCLLWLAFLLIEFCAEKPAGALASIGAIAACAYVHEAAVLCLFLIALAALLRTSDTKRISRVAMFLVAVIATAGAGNMLRWILVPRSAVERDNFLASAGGFLGWPSDPNIPAIVGVIAAAAVLAAEITTERRAWTVALVAIALMLALFVVLLIGADLVIAPSRFFAARGLPVALTTLLVGFFLVLRRRGETPTRFATPPVLAIVLSLAIFQPAAQAVITKRWDSYVQALRALVSTESGAVPHGLAMRRLDPQNVRFRRELLESWSVEPLSILLAPGGRVTAVLEPWPGERWIPWRADDPASLPHLPQLDWSHYSPRGRS
jgi:hypothetical protein